LSKGGLVLDEQQMFCRISHLPGRQHIDTAAGLGPTTST
jgi:hypothetical protein